MLYDLERLKLRIYEGRGSCTEDEVDLWLIDLFDVNSVRVVGGRETRSRSLGGENRITFSRVKADGNIF